MNNQEPPVTERCAVASCEQPVVGSCFECDRFCCARHLSAVTFAAANRTVRIRICPECHHRYSIDPEIQPLLKDDFARLT